MAQAINGKLDSLQVKVVEHEGSLCDTKEHTEEVLLPVNKAKVHSSEDIDFLTSPLVEEFGYQCNEQTENAVLQGSYVPPPFGLLLLQARPKALCGPAGIATQRRPSAHCRPLQRLETC